MPIHHKIATKIKEQQEKSRQREKEHLEKQIKQSAEKAERLEAHATLLEERKAAREKVAKAKVRIITAKAKPVSLSSPTKKKGEIVSGAVGAGKGIGRGIGKGLSTFDRIMCIDGSSKKKKKGTSKKIHRTKVKGGTLLSRKKITRRRRTI